MVVTPVANHGAMDWLGITTYEENRLGGVMDILLNSPYSEGKETLKSGTPF